MSPSALVVSPRVIAREQLASLLSMHGWQTTCLHEFPDSSPAPNSKLHWLIVDITREHPKGMLLIRQIARQPWSGYLAGICEGGATPMMREARYLGIDGFFYLNRHGKAIDPQRGLAALLLSHKRDHSCLERRNADTPPRRQSTIPPGNATTMSTNSQRMAMDAAASG